MMSAILSLIMFAGIVAMVAIIFWEGAKEECDARREKNEEEKRRWREAREKEDRIELLKDKAYWLAVRLGDKIDDVRDLCVYSSGYFKIRQYHFERSGELRFGILLYYKNKYGNWQKIDFESPIGEALMPALTAWLEEEEEKADAEQNAEEEYVKGLVQNVTGSFESMKGSEA